MLVYKFDGLRVIFFPFHFFPNDLDGGGGGEKRLRLVVVVRRDFVCRLVFSVAILGCRWRV